MSGLTSGFTTVTRSGTRGRNIAIGVARVKGGWSGVSITAVSCCRSGSSSTGGSK